MARRHDDEDQMCSLSKGRMSVYKRKGEGFLWLEGCGGCRGMVLFGRFF
jgi:hypothetical protein